MRRHRVYDALQYWLLSRGMTALLSGASARFTTANTIGPSSHLHAAIWVFSSLYAQLNTAYLCSPSNLERYAVQNYTVGAGYWDALRDAVTVR
jgi:hypothetical protein